ncbi:MAG: hypothetical protein C4523_01045 [Myxococcales bacterium]|nr:MAG: hypothetical protein C4523_01045 [Myxococcales bacterium]
MGDRIITWIIRARWGIVAFYAVLVALAVSALPELGVNFSFRQFFPPSDPDVQRYNTFNAEFGYDDTYALFALTSPDLLTPEKLAVIDRFTERLKQIDGVTSVESITTLKRGVWKDDRFYMERIFPTLPPSPEELESGKRYLLANEFTKSNFISGDGATTVVAAEVDYRRNDSETARRPIVLALWAALDEIRPHFSEVRQSGVPIVRSQYGEIIAKNTMGQLPLATLVILIVLIASFRHWAGVVFSLLVVFLAMVYTFGLMAALGYKITIMSNILPVMLMITGISDAIHLHSRYYEELRRGHPKLEALRIAMRHLALACFITSFTTAVGFGVLLFTSIDILREYGGFVGLGVMITYVISLTFLPAMLAILPAPPSSVTNRYFEGRAGSVVAWTIRQVLRHQRAWMIGAAVVLVFSLAGSAMVQRSTRLFEDLPDDHPIIATLHFFEKQLGGVLPIEIVVDGGGEDAMKAPEAQRLVDDIKRFLLTIPEIRKAITSADFLKEMNELLNEGKPEFYALPDSAELNAQYLLLYGMSEDDPTEKYLTPDARKARVSSRVTDVYSERAREIQATIQNYLDRRVHAPYTAQITGTWPIAHKINLYVIDQIFWTFMIAFVVIFFALGAQFGSLRIALLSMSPNVFPLIITLGVMGWGSIYLKPTSAVTFAIAFGIAVDDTIHFLTRFLKEFPRDGNYEAAVERSLAGAGHAMITTTVIILSGFMVPLVFSELVSNRVFSLLAGVCIVAALIADLFLNPIQLLWVRPSLGKKPPVR